MKLQQPPPSRNHSSSVHQTWLKNSQPLHGALQQVWSTTDSCWSWIMASISTHCGGKHIHIRVCTFMHVLVQTEGLHPTLSTPSHCKVHLQSCSGSASISSAFQRNSMCCCKAWLKGKQSMQPSPSRQGVSTACINSSRAWCEQGREASMINRSNYWRPFLLRHLCLSLYKCSTSYLLQMLLRHGEASVNNDQSL